MSKLKGQEALAVFDRLEMVSQGQPLTKRIKDLYSQITVLDLCEEHIDKVPAAIGELTSLRKLNLSNTRITELPAAIGQLVSLHELNLSYTYIQELPATTGQLIGLRKLYLSGTNIKEFPAVIGQLTSLDTLSLSHTQIKELPAAIGRLTSLRTLYLRGTMIRELPAEIGQLTSLRELNLSHSYIQELPATIGQLTSLSSLYLKGIWIQELPAAIGKLTNLCNLDLSDTQIKELPAEIEQLTNLRTLDLSGTQITELPEEILNLSLPFVDAAPSNWRDGGINIHDTTIISPPADLLLSNDVKKIRAWYQANRGLEETIPLNEAKIIFLGEPSAGKTHSIQRIMQGGVDNGLNPEETHGINIEKWKQKQSDLTFHLWDFGGQQIMHSMHRCFLTQNCLYVVVLRARSDSQNNTLTQQAKYWLNNIDSFAPNSRVLLAINRTSDNSGGGYCHGINMEQLREDYKDRLIIYDAITYSAKSCRQDNFDGFMKALVKYASGLDTVSRRISAKWNKVRKYLDEINSYHGSESDEKRPYIDEQKYQGVCRQYGVTDKTSQELLLTMLNELGVCFSYHETEEYGGEQLENYQVLNPEWLTTAIYAIITSGQAGTDRSRNPYHSHHGKIRHNQILKLLNDQKIQKTSKENIRYEEFEVQYILEVMRKFRLSYLMSEHGNNDTEFIPALCPKDTPKDFRPDVNLKKLSYQMKYGFLPDTVVHRLMIACVDKLNIQKCYFQGLRIDDKTSGLVAVADMRTTLDTLYIDIYDTKGKMQAWELLNDLRKEIAEINRRLNLSPEGEYISVTKGSQTAIIKLVFLLNLKDKQRIEYDFEDINGDILTLRIDEVLGMVYGEENVSKANERMEKGEENTFLEALQNDSSRFIYLVNEPVVQPIESQTPDDEPTIIEQMEGANTLHDFIHNLIDYGKWFFYLIVFIAIIVCLATGNSAKVRNLFEALKQLFSVGAAG